MNIKEETKLYLIQLHKLKQVLSHYICNNFILIQTTSKKVKTMLAKDEKMKNSEYLDAVFSTLTEIIEREKAIPNKLEETVSNWGKTQSINEFIKMRKEPLIYYVEYIRNFSTCEEAVASIQRSKYLNNLLKQAETFINSPLMDLLFAPLHHIANFRYSIRVHFQQYFFMFKRIC